MKTVLIIGGPADGQRMSVGDSVWEIVIPEMPSEELLSVCSAVPGVIPKLCKYQYHIHEHFTDRDTHYVATLNRQLYTSELIKALWEGYKKNSDPAPPVADDYAVLRQKLDAVLAEHPDARRMDWLVSKCVEVRQPLRYGSAAMFRSHAITDEEDEHYATKLREQIDNAILSEGATHD